MIFQHEVTNQPEGKRQHLESVSLPSNCPSTSRGVLVSVTEAPHRDGNPDHKFYEVWFNWEGGSLRSSSAIHDEDARDIVFEFIEALTGIYHDDTLNPILDKYDWSNRTTDQDQAKKDRPHHSRVPAE